MRSLYAVYRKEMGHYFVSPVAYVVVGIFLFVSAFFFNLYLVGTMEQAMQAQMQGAQFGTSPSIDVAGEVLRAFLGFLALIFLFLLPMLTMGIYAEEKKRGTIELLMTSPITELQIVLGKFFASLSLFIVMLLPTAFYMSFVWFHTDPRAPLRIVLTGFLGVILFGGSLLALGSFFSSLTENQIIAGAISFGAFLLLWALDFGSRNSTGAFGQVLQYLSVINHFDDFTRGVIDTSGLIYYFSVITLFIFLTVRSVDSMRWRRA